MKFVNIRILFFVAACAAFSLPVSAETVGGGAPASVAPPETVGGGESVTSSETADGEVAPPETVGGGDALLAWFEILFIR
ncbi:MAG TPA: hypothetical protein VFP95_04235 [Gammaproteobacteria bacterium]|nr:hypothetical protein [Gammaproteobacteria bacterium]